jgi:hypothetical protein
MNSFTLHELAYLPGCPTSRLSIVLLLILIHNSFFIWNSHHYSDLFVSARTMGKSSLFMDAISCWEHAP